MPISGLVLTLSSDTDRRNAALGKLDAEPNLTVGELDGVFLPVVVEAESAGACIEVCERLFAVPGVEMVSVAHVDFAEGF
jgi:hypothetical protein